MRLNEQEYHETTYIHTVHAVHGGKNNLACSILVHSAVVGALAKHIVYEKSMKPFPEAHQQE